jgi:hypothetical protein
MKCQILLPSESLSPSFFIETNFYDFFFLRSCESVLDNKPVLNFSVPKKQPTKIRGKQPKSSKKQVKFISEYHDHTKKIFF